LTPPKTSGLRSCSPATPRAREFERKSGRKAAVEAIWALQGLLDAKRAMVVTGRFSTRMTWDGSGNGHWDVVLTQLVNGRSVLPYWIGASSTVGA